MRARGCVSACVSVCTCLCVCAHRGVPLMMVVMTRVGCLSEASGPAVIEGCLLQHYVLRPHPHTQVTHTQSRDHRGPETYRISVDLVSFTEAQRSLYRLYNLGT